MDILCDMHGEPQGSILCGMEHEGWAVQLALRLKGAFGWEFANNWV